MGQQNQKQQKAIEQEPHHHRRLPLEMESEIFKFLKWQIQLKLIASMGRGIYGLFHQRLIIKVKRLQNPTENYLVLTESKIKIVWDRLKCMTCNWLGIAPDRKWKYIFAKKGFVISEGCSRKDNFPSTIVYYFEVTQSASIWSFYVCLSNGIIPYDYKWLCEYPKFYMFSDCKSYKNEYCWLAGNLHKFEWPNGPIKVINCNDNDEFTIGCGLLLDPENKLSIFFTANGILLGKPIPIRPLFDTLIPTVCMLPSYSVKANFGDNLAKKPFKFNINSLQLELK